MHASSPASPLASWEEGVVHELAETVLGFIQDVLDIQNERAGACQKCQTGYRNATASELIVAERLREQVRLAQRGGSCNPEGGPPPDPSPADGGVIRGAPASAPGHWDGPTDSCCRPVNMQEHA